MKWIIVYGNPVDGFKFFGLFDTEDEAINYADADDGKFWEWSIAEIEIHTPGER